MRNYCAVTNQGNPCTALQVFPHSDMLGPVEFDMKGDLQKSVVNPITLNTMTPHSVGFGDNAFIPSFSGKIPSTLGSSSREKCRGESISSDARSFVYWRTERGGAVSGAPPARNMPQRHASFLSNLKKRIQQDRLQVVLASNAALVILCWDIGQGILRKQKCVPLPGIGPIEQLCKDPSVFDFFLDHGPAPGS